MKDSGTWFVIANPASGRNLGRERWKKVERVLRSLHISLEVHETTRQGQAEEVAGQAIEAGHRQILVAGGDGTVHEVVNGIMSSAVDDTAGVTLAVAPVGTGNDWSRSLGITAEPSSIARVLEGGQRMLHDVGLLEVPGRSDFKRWFINVAGAGYDAHVVTRLPVQVPSQLAYLKGALFGLFSYKSPHFRITANAAVIEDRLLLAFVANGQYCGNRMHVAPGARLDDGLLDLVTVRELGIIPVLFKLPKLFRGDIIGDPAVHHLRADRVRIEAEPPVNVQADGQIVGTTPVELSVNVGALRVAVP